MPVLILSRRKLERIVLANGLVRITVMEIKGDKVRIGIEAPPELTIHREEVQKRIDEQGYEKRRPTP